MIFDFEISVLPIQSQLLFGSIFYLKASKYLISVMTGRKQFSKGIINGKELVELTKREFEEVLKFMPDYFSIEYLFNADPLQDPISIIYRNLMLLVTLDKIMFLVIANYKARIPLKNIDKKFAEFKSLMLLLSHSKSCRWEPFDLTNLVPYTIVHNALGLISEYPEYFANYGDSFRILNDFKTLAGKLFIGYSKTLPNFPDQVLKFISE